MKQQQAAPVELNQRPGPDTEALLLAIQEQGRQTLALVRTLVGLLVPKEGGREGPPLEDLLAAIIAQQREIIAGQHATHAEIARLAEALDEGRAPQRVRPS